MARLRTISSLGDLEGKRVLVRVDLNLPIWRGRVTDDSRIRAIIPTVEALIDQGARPILISHSGRPEGKFVPELSLSPLLDPLREVLEMDVAFSPETVGKVAAETIAGCDAPVVILENVRFYPGEESNDPEFAAELAALGEAYLNDAFSVAHRAHASTEGITKFLPSAAGLAMAHEIEALDKVLGNPERPLVAVVGGAKVSTKLRLLENLTGRVDHLIIGGAMANSFLAAQGYDVGSSLAELDLLDEARRVMTVAEQRGCHIHLPMDVVLASEFKEGTSSRVAELDELENIGDGELILDLGPKTVQALIAVLETCKSLVWNGPLGAFEMTPFDGATVALAQAAARLAGEGKILAVAGGGDTLAALAHAGVKDDFSYVSTAGGAFLEWMEGKTLPGVEALKETN